MQQQVSKTWMQKNWKWFVPLGCFGFLVVAGVAIFLFVMLIFGIIKKTEPYQYGLQAAVSHPEIRDALGEPIEPAFYLAGNVEVSGGSGTADLSIPVKGPRGSATIYVQAEKSAGKWHYRLVEAVIEPAGSRINLLEPGRLSPLGEEVDAVADLQKQMKG